MNITVENSTAAMCERLKTVKGEEFTNIITDQGEGREVDKKLQTPSCL